MFPSTAQLEKLVEFMESKRWLATGHARTAHARDRCRQAWLEISNSLNNNDGNGCIKMWQQWQKYWKDKKGAVKRKCSSIARARRITGGGLDATAVAELSHLEQRIVSLMGGESFATGQLDLELPVIQDAQTVDDHESSEQSQSILRQQIIINNDSVPLFETENSLMPINLSAMAVAGDESTREIDYSSQVQEVTETPRPPAVDAPVLPTSPVIHSSRLITDPSTHMSTAGESERRQDSSPRRRDAPSSPRRPRRLRRGGVNTPSARRRLLRRSPPSQRRSELASLTDRFIAIEERRTETEALLARSQEIYSQAHHRISESLAQLAQAWTVHAQALNNLALATSNRDRI